MMSYTMQTQTPKRNPARFTQCAEINRRKFPNCLQGISGLSQNSASTRTGRYAFHKGKSGILCENRLFRSLHIYEVYGEEQRAMRIRLSQALARMTAEDVTLKSVNDSENRQTLLYGMGDQHLEIAASKLAARYKVEITLETPKVAFRETIRKNSDVDMKYKKQTGGHGQYGHVKMKFEPSHDLDTPYVFEECVVGGAVPKNYFPAVEKGLAGIGS